ncbi:MAG: hypothetical protein WBL63_18190 [Candidatus Acidiferrum sp.]
MWVVVFMAAVSLGTVAYLAYFGLKKTRAESAWKTVDAGANTEAAYRSKFREQSSIETQQGASEVANGGVAVQVHVKVEPAHGKWDDTNYYWIVFCKNHWVHFRQNLFFRHRILLGETDEVMPPPELKGPFVARCDDCGKEYLYKPSDLLKHEEELEKAFTPHPLFR